MFFFFFNKTTAKIVLGLFGIGIVVLFFYWLFSGEVRRDLHPVMEELSIQTSREFGNQLPRIQTIENLLVVPMVGVRHEDDKLREIVLSSIERQRKYTVWTWASLKDKLGNGDLWGQLMDRVGMISGEPRNPEQAKKVVKQLRLANIDVDGVLFVKCYFDQGQRSDCLGAKIKLEGNFYDSKKEKELPSESLSVEKSISNSWNYLYLTHKLYDIGFVSRWFMWLAIVLFQPFVLLGIVKKAIQMRSNTAIIAVLVFFTLVGVLSSWPLIFVLGYGPGSIVGVMVVAGLCAYYNYDALSYFEKKF